MNPKIKIIKVKIVGPSLSAAGYSCKTPRALVFGPDKYGRMDWEYPFMTTVIGKTKLIIGSVRRQDIVGQMTVLQLSWLQLISGIQSSIFKSGESIPYLPNSWLTNTQHHLATAGIKIKIANIWLPKKQREHDQKIMDYIRHNLPEWAWESINTCRLYIQAITFSDITTYDGKWIS